MKPIGTFNRLPKNFKQPERLKPGQTVTYRFMPDFERHVILDKNGTKEVRWPASIQIPTLDTIQVSFKDENGEEKTELIDIGLVNRIDPKEGYPVVEPWFIEAHAARGEFQLTGGSIDDERKYWLAEIFNFNDSNPNRDKKKTPLFYRVDKEAEASQRNKQTELELECLLFIKNLTSKELNRMAAAFQLNENEPDSILRSKLNELARKDPETFNRLSTSKDVETKVTIQRALKAEVIKYNPQQHKIVWGSNNSTIASLSRVEGVSWQEQFSDWIKSHKNGPATYENIVKILG